MHGISIHLDGITMVWTLEATEVVAGRDHWAPGTGLLSDQFNGRGVESLQRAVEQIALGYWWNLSRTVREKESGGRGASEAAGPGDPGEPA